MSNAKVLTPDEVAFIANTAQYWETDAGTKLCASHELLRAENGELREVIAQQDEDGSLELRAAKTKILELREEIANLREALDNAEPGEAGAG
jgi:hypothetical protein